MRSKIVSKALGIKCFTFLETTMGPADSFRADINNNQKS